MNQYPSIVTDRLDSEARRRDTALATWLLMVAAMVFGMTVLGGLTRLTHSGLSMVDWRPLTGWLPPMSTPEWQALFDAYRQFPEYQKINFGMSLSEFKGIFWLEYIHRLWGRLIGVVFAVPFVVFLIRGWITRAMLPKLIVMFVLGGLQGVLSWYMVKSGLVDRPDVSQYRLTAHLGAAFVIYGYIIWVALALLRPQASDPAGASLRGSMTAVTALVFVTSLSGGFVAGLDAGLYYNTFPLMHDTLVPEDLFAISPFYLSFFEDVTTVQFTHRVLAITTFAVIAVLWMRSLRLPLTRASRLAMHAVFAAAIVQVALGIATLLLFVPVALAAAHQAGAVVLLSAALWATFELRHPSSLARRTDVTSGAARAARAFGE